MRDARTLRTLALLDLESHPPAAAIDRVVVAVDPTPGRIVQFSLLSRALPSPERLSTLIARLDALLGDGRCGAPAPVDTWQSGAFAMRPFAPRDADITDPRHAEPPNQRVSVSASPVAVKDASNRADPRDSRDAPVVALRRFRVPIAVRVRVDAGAPVRVLADGRGFAGGAVERCAGPWRTSGAWWEAETPEWDRDEWDVALREGGTYRIFRERNTDGWFVDGMID
jgi:hypothetical protein